MSRRRDSALPPVETAEGHCEEGTVAAVGVGAERKRQA
jgi:hypothetical protein